MPFADPKDVRLLVLDVDGVMTDGSIWLDTQGREIKRFNIRDGLAISVWMKLGFHAAIVTGRPGGAVDARANELGIGIVITGAADKRAALDEVSRRSAIAPASMAAIGDDWPDLPLLRAVGYPIAVADAEPEVLEAAAWRTSRPGGHGAVREAIWRLLEARGAMERARSLYH